MLDVAPAPKRGSAVYRLPSRLLRPAFRSARPRAQRCARPSVCRGMERIASPLSLGLDGSSLQKSARSYSVRVNVYSDTGHPSRLAVGGAHGHPGCRGSGGAGAHMQTATPATIGRSTETVSLRGVRPAGPAADPRRLHTPRRISRNPVLTADRRTPALWRGPAGASDDARQASIRTIYSVPEGCMRPRHRAERHGATLVAGRLRSIERAPTTPHFAVTGRRATTTGSRCRPSLAGGTEPLRMCHSHKPVVSPPPTRPLGACIHQPCVTCTRLCRGACIPNLTNQSVRSAESAPERSVRR
jgi:hypothetical protein